MKTVLLHCMIIKKSDRSQVKVLKNGVEVNLQTAKWVLEAFPNHNVIKISTNKSITWDRFLLPAGRNYIHLLLFRMQR